MDEVVMEIKNLKTYFWLGKDIVRAVDGIDLQISQGKTVALVGESGCGKSVTALSIMKLIPSPPAKIVDGIIEFEGKDLVKLSNEEMNLIRGSKISMIFQDPMTALNPVITVGDQISEVILHHKKVPEKMVEEYVIELLSKVGIASPVNYYRSYPHQLSGGMRQRVMIAMAIACNPKLIIADEPTTALDVTVQAQVLELLRKLQSEIGTSLLFITHDFRVVAEMADSVAVMYGGKIVEYSPILELFEEPLHPYTRALIKSIPAFDNTTSNQKKRLQVIPGTVPDLREPFQGCIFSNRCEYSLELCHKESPPNVELGHGRKVMCWLHV